MPLPLPAPAPAPSAPAEAAADELADQILMVVSAEQVAMFLQGV